MEERYSFTFRLFTTVQNLAPYDLQYPRHTTLHGEDIGYNNVASDVSALMVEKYGFGTGQSQPSCIRDGKIAHTGRDAFIVVPTRTCLEISVFSLIAAVLNILIAWISWI